MNISKNTSKANKKGVIPNTGNAPQELGDNDNLTYYQIFFMSLISLLLVFNILFQKGVTNIIIKRTWGMNNFSYFPWWVQAVVFIILFALAVPSVNNSFRMLIEKTTLAATGKITGNYRKIIWFTGISSCIALLFYFFRVKYDLLGDMNLRVSQSVEKKYIDDEYFTMYFMHYLIIVLQKLIHFNPHQAFVFASVAAGFCYCFLGLLIADLLFTDMQSVVIFFLFYISIGNLLVFCGYTEIYAIPAASASLYMYTALLFLKKKISIIFPFLCMVLAVALHKEQVSVLPSFVYLVTRKIKFLQKIDVKIILVLFLISIPLEYILNNIFHLQELMSLTKDKQFPEVNTLFSFSNLWEFFNSQYISSGILIFLFIFILVKVVKGQIQLDDYSKFFLIATLFIYSIIITMNKERGSGDWDVCSFPAIYLSMFVAYTVLINLKVIYSKRKFFYIISIALLINTLSCWAWIGLNSGKKSLNKIEDMLLTDPGWYYKVKFPSEMELSILFYKYSTLDKAGKYYKLCYDKYRTKKEDAVTNYVGFLTLTKDTDKLTPVCEYGISLYPNYLPDYYILFSIYGKGKQEDKIYNLAKLFVKTYDRVPASVIKDQDGKTTLMYSINYLKNYSLARNDIATYNDALLRMEKLKNILPPINSAPDTKTINKYRVSYEKYRKQSLDSVVKYVDILEQDKDTNKLMPVCEDAVLLYPDYLTGYYLLFSIYEKRKLSDKMYNLSKLFVKTYDRNPANVLKDPNGKNTLIFSINNLYQISLAKNDIAINRDAIERMKQLHINLPSR